jgi:hypothetical protein
MNKVLTITVVIVVLVAGCSKHQSRESVQTATNQIATSDPIAASSPPTTQPRKIVGAFGWNLGQSVTPNELVSAGFHLNHEGTTTIDDDWQLKTKDFPPFSDIFVHLLNDGRIYSVSALGSGDNYDMIRTALAEKYGEVKPANEHGYSWVVDDGYASIKLGVGSITFVVYSDHALNQIHEAERRAEITPHL